MKKTILSLTAVLLLGLFAAFSIPAPKTPAASKARSDKFVAFLKQFKPQELPYTITKEEMQQYIETGLKNSEQGLNANRVESGPILDDPYQFIPQSRMEAVSRSPMYKKPVAQLATTTHAGVIYATYRGYSPAFQYYQIAVFTKDGVRLAIHDLAFTGVHQLQVATINAQLIATLQTYHINWENDIRESGTENNRITSLSLENTKEVDLTIEPENKGYEIFRKKPLKTEIPAETIGAVLH